MLPLWEDLVSVEINSVRKLHCDQHDIEEVSC